MARGRRTTSSPQCLFLAAGPRTSESASRSHHRNQPTGIQYSPQFALVAQTSCAGLRRCPLPRRPLADQSPRRCRPPSDPPLDRVAALRVGEPSPFPRRQRLGRSAEPPGTVNHCGCGCEHARQSGTRAIRVASRTGSRWSGRPRSVVQRNGGNISVTTTLIPVA